MELCGQFSVLLVYKYVNFLVCYNHVICHMHSGLCCAMPISVAYIQFRPIGVDRRKTQYCVIYRC